MKNNNLLRIKEKQEKLASIIKNFGSLIVAFSGGVDSSFLLAMANNVLKNNVVAISAMSPIHPSREIEYSKKFTNKLKIKQIIIKSREINHAKFMANKKDRCYICKKLLFEDMLKIASDMSIKYIAHGANLNDLDDFRPGLLAAKEMGVVAPLIDAGLTKANIRSLSKEMKLSTWDKPSMACLATRIPYGKLLTKKALSMIERAENCIIDLGCKTCRVRLHGKVARIEVKNNDIKKITNETNRKIIINKFKKIGFYHIALDMEGYIRGSLNRS